LLDAVVRHAAPRAAAGLLCTLRSAKRHFIFMTPIACRQPPPVIRDAFLPRLILRCRCATMLMTR
jgi:hypothetical protein